jgi:hypothetical protein
VATGEYYLQGSEIAVIDVQQDQVARSFPTGMSFVDIAYAGDGSVALLVVIDRIGYPIGLATVDLTSGEVSRFQSGSFGQLVMR